MTKTDPGRFFEDFHVGERLDHPTPRTLTEGDASAYMALHAPRQALFSSAPFAAACGLERAPLNPWLVFHTVFGKTVPDVSLNAVANLGYGEGRWLAPVRAGDTLSAASEVIGVKETSNGRSGVVYVRTTGVNQRGEPVLSYVRWVMVRKRDPASPAPPPQVPTLSGAVAAADLTPPPGLDFRGYDFTAAGATHAFEDYGAGERIDHVDGMAVEEAEAQMATRLYQNTAKVHFNAHERAQDPSGRRLVYGGVVISTAAALAFNGLQNAGLALALNGGRHANPFHAGRTLFAWSQVLDRAVLDAERRIGALRLRLVAAMDRPCADFPDRDEAGVYPPEVALDLDYWAAIPMRGLMAFALDPRLARESVPVATLDLCEVRLQDDARWPWLVLIPRRVGLVELGDLETAERAILIEEVVRAGEAVRAMGAGLGAPVAKLNVGALGNVVAQLHVHVIGRRPGDPAGQAPVWGVGSAARYADDDRARAVAAAVRSLAGPR